ncbi:hypothetical protein SCHPADRAFT_904518 [Schizopora paradoxa]|uniref:Uncharacterized protein n=1 Tax=Schizopora paradoxa TaxID=27342 RepID=A0A0H2S8B6_9AGAM|nr:hypothetical protein SCHPADRAFT_904518 [Schizopora paradoxa]
MDMDIIAHYHTLLYTDLSFTDITLRTFLSFLDYTTRSRVSHSFAPVPTTPVAPYYSFSFSHLISSLVYLVNFTCNADRFV